MCAPKYRPCDRDDSNEYVLSDYVSKASYLHDAHTCLAGMGRLSLTTEPEHDPALTSS